MQTFIKEIAIDESVRNLCFRPYHNHPKGCPNYGERITCPPRCPVISDIYDLQQGFWVVWIEFNLENHRKKMRMKHSDWSKRQLDCCLYWQGKANKLLKREVKDIEYYLEGTGPWKTTYCPEAMGVNVTETMRSVGVELEWPPEKIVRKVAVIGVAITPLSKQKLEAYEK